MTEKSISLLFENKEIDEEDLLEKVLETNFSPWLKRTKNYKNLSRTSHKQKFSMKFQLE